VTIDVHTHVVPAELGARSVAQWPTIERRADGTAAMLVDGRLYRSLDARSWDPSARASAMDAEEVRIQALSAMPELFGYWFDPKHGAEMASRVNDLIGEMVSARPDRFVGLGTVSLQDIELALRQVEWLQSAGFAGVEIGTHINGISIADERFAPVFSALERSGLCVLIHSVRPRGFDSGGSVIGLEMLVGYPLDTARTFAELLGAKFPARYPELRLGFCHCGGAAGMLLPRLRRGTAFAPHIAEYFGDVDQAARSFYYDSLLFDTQLLRWAVAAFGSNRIMVGSDFPYPIYARRPGTAIEELGLDARQSAAMLEGNARQFLGLTR
jgi:aminocarboxymuconate-semialdehyde decarboxylase